MTLQRLLPLLLALTITSCSRKAIVLEDAPVEAPRPAKPTGGPTAPLPLSSNPFAVPDVTGDLPSEEDLKSRTPRPPGIPIEPVDQPENTPATATVRPPAPPADPVSPDSGE